VAKLALAAGAVLSRQAGSSGLNVGNCAGGARSAARGRHVSAKEFLDLIEGA